MKIANWKNRRIEDHGSIVSPDYTKFQGQYRRDLKKVASENGWELASFNKSHYDFSAFLHNPETGKYAYLSISDVRTFLNDWADNILIRSAEHVKDYRGGRNQRATIDTLVEDLSPLLD